MKKTLSLLLILAFMLSLVGCGLGHKHEFVLSEADSKPAKCTMDGVEVLVCSCGERQETVLPALGHDQKVIKDSKPTCVSQGTTSYRCSRCNEMTHEKFAATGHNFEEVSAEPSRPRRCLNENCSFCAWDEPNNKNKEALTFAFTKEDEEQIEAKYQEVLAMLQAADRYDPALHAYAETGPLVEQFEVVNNAHNELYDWVLYAISQKKLAEVAYYCNMSDKALEESFSYMMDYQTDLIARFYTLSRPFYDSCYRELYYYGMTEEEINAYLFESDIYSNPEYTALKERNNAIEVEFLAIYNPNIGNKVPELYAEFAENNNKMAQMMGYDNYLEYAYKNVYGRDYTYSDVSAISDYAQSYLSPSFNKMLSAWNALNGYSDADLEWYYIYTTYPFFDYIEANSSVNDYIDQMAFTTNPDKNITFSDEFNKLIADGNLFRGTYGGAFVTTIHSADMPIAYFGNAYDNCFSITHEFGHYMNEIYNAKTYESGEFVQSLDLLEMHSQGDELLYLYYLRENGQCSENAMKMIETYVLIDKMYSIFGGLTVDAFEQAIYLNTYDGTNAEEIMADGTITWDEYDLLYRSICEDYGVAA
ncbi:MAG: hypothetical protein IKZ16_04340, partial [Clostridia bacterium]|nr:hypothetical protein [Clostridia bacterium]